MVQACPRAGALIGPCAWSFAWALPW